jgi:hypothetical protein
MLEFWVTDGDMTAIDVSDLVLFNSFESSSCLDGLFTSYPP